MKILAIYLCLISYAFGNTYEINKDHSRVQFSVDYMSLTKVEGIFKKYNGSFNFENNELKELKVVIEADSVDTNEPKRDQHLKGQEFLFASKYPEIIFESNGVKLIENKKNQLAGNLSIRGIKKNITGDLIFKGKALDPWGKENLFFEFKTELNRQDFEMKWNKALDQGGYLVGDKVQIVILVQAQKAGEKTASSTHLIPSTKGIIERDQLKKGKIKKLSTSTDPNDKKN